MTRSAAAMTLRAGAADAALLVLALVLVAMTVVIIAVPTVAPAILDDRLDLAITTSATLVAGAVAALEWARGRVAGDQASLMRGSAFVVLAVLNAATLLVLLANAEGAIGASLDAPGQLPLLAGAVARGTCAVLLIASGIPAVRRGGGSFAPAVIGLGPALLVLGAILLAAGVQESLPALVDSSVLDRLRQAPTEILEPGDAPRFVVVQVAIGACFLVAAILAHRAYRSTGRPGEAVMAAGLLVAAFSQIHVALHPGSYASLTTTGDFLRLAFYGTLLAGIVVDRRDDLRELRAANTEIRRLAEAEVASAALEERARLAREIHDGLAQDLWYAKLKQSRLDAIAGFEGEARQLSDEVRDAIDASLAEARHAVAAMRESAGPGGLLEMLQRHVEDFSDRFAPLRAELTLDGAPPSVEPRVAAEILRIVQEALTNARRHADATVIRLHVATSDGLRLVVADNGRGFREDQRTSGFGLDSMRQRAELIGGRLAISSQPGDGTRVSLEVPSEREENR